MPSITATSFSNRCCCVEAVSTTVIRTAICGHPGEGDVVVFGAINPGYVPGQATLVPAGDAVSEYSQGSLGAATQERGHGIILGSRYGVTEQGHGRGLASTQGRLGETRVDLGVRRGAGLLEGLIHG